jgi:hypothetical protein
VVGPRHAVAQHLCVQIDTRPQRQKSKSTHPAWKSPNRHTRRGKVQIDTHGVEKSKSTHTAWVMSSKGRGLG